MKISINLQRWKLRIESLQVALRSVLNKLLEGWRGRVGVVPDYKVVYLGLEVRVDVDERAIGKGWPGWGVHRLI